MIKAVLKPRGMKKVPLWAGIYGGHYEIVVFFREKPTHRMDKNSDTRSNGKYVDVLEECRDDNVYADLATGTFEDWFLLELPRAKDTEVLYRELFEIELTIPVDEYGDWCGLDVHCDWPGGKLSGC